jgi:hypothetical protein
MGAGYDLYTSQNLGEMGSGQTGDDWFNQNAPPADTAATPPIAQPGGGGGLQGDAAFDEFGRAWTASGGQTVADLKAFADQWNASNPGAKVTLGGSKGDKVYGPNGEFWNDAVISAGLGGKGASWGPKGGGGGGVNMGEFGSLAQGWDKEFKAPTIEEMRAMPGYQFALNEGIDALDKTAAARGTGLSGGQKKDVLNYAIGLADQTGQQKYQNALGEYKTAYDVFRNNGNDLFDRYDRLAARGTGAAGAATS